MAEATVQTRVLILGGGVTGLWLLDELRRSGVGALLVEARALGSGQTIAAQGIIHGGLKYTLSGRMTDAAKSIREMPDLWRRCLAGEASPDLSKTRLRAERCMLWRTSELSSRLGMIGARFGLRVAPKSLAAAERPPLLRACPGTVAVLDEQVIQPATMLHALAGAHPGRVLLGSDVEVESTDPFRVRVRHGEQAVVVKCDRVVLAAGAGNAELREAFGLDAALMQRRPLHMTVVRNREAKSGPLEVINGHCVDGARTRVTITSEMDDAGRVLWQVGGEVSEVGVSMSRDELIRHVRSELAVCLPDLRFDTGGGVEWSTYRVDRAERTTPGNRRPDMAAVITEERVTTVWPTKMVLAPIVASAVCAELRTGTVVDDDLAGVAGWPAPTVALPPWAEAPWTADDSVV